MMIKMDELKELANQILETIQQEDKEYDFYNGGMYRNVVKAKEVQTK